MEQKIQDFFSQVDILLNGNNLFWLLGAGISSQSGIPLMTTLTNCVENELNEPLIASIKKTLGPNAHIEHILSQIGDYRSIAERSESKSVTLAESTITIKELDELHQKILGAISEIIRWGYQPATGETELKIGNKSETYVKIDAHRKFISALFDQRQRGISNRRRPVKLFTTNYDTLIEDSLALECVPYWDGFSGGAVAFRNYRYGENEPVDRFRAHVIKLHGSIDWRLDDKWKIYRVRDGDNYPEDASRVLIYPQSTKYIATQRDPFAAQFDLFRRSLLNSDENILSICGYGFGDEHINNEIELAMASYNNRTTIIVFSQNLDETLKKWLNLNWSKRLYIITEKHLYNGNDDEISVEKSLRWTFESVARFLANGPEGL